MQVRLSFLPAFVLFIFYPLPQFVFVICAHVQYCAAKQKRDGDTMAGWENQGTGGGNGRAKVFIITVTTFAKSPGRCQMFDFRVITLFFVLPPRLRVLFFQLCLESVLFALITKKRLLQLQICGRVQRCCNCFFFYVHFVFFIFLYICCSLPV